MSQHGDLIANKSHSLFLKRYRVPLLLGSIVALALALRLWGIDFSLPYLAHPDEGYLMMPALKMIKTGSFNPERFEYGTFFIYTLVPVLSLAFLLLTNQGTINGVDQILTTETHFELAAYPHPTFFLAGRLWVAVLGSATVLLVYYVAKTYAGTRAGLIAATLLALFPTHSLHAHFATTDVPATFLAACVLVLVSSSRVMEHRLGPFLAGIITGLGISTKYSLAPLLLVPLAAILLMRKEARWTWLRLALITAGAALGFLAGTPYALASYRLFLETLAWQMRVYNPAQPTAGGGALPLLLKDLVQLNVLILLVPALLGFLLLLRKNVRVFTLLVVFPIGLLLSVVSQTVYYSRNLLTTVPFMVVAAAIGIDHLWRNTALHRPLKGRHLSIMFLALYIGMGVYVIVGDDMRLAGKDVRAQALEQALAVIPQGSTVGLDLGTFMPPPGHWDARRFIFLGTQSFDEFQEQGFDYFMMSEPIFSNPNVPAPVAQNHRELRERAQLVATFTGSYYNRPQREIWLYRLPQ